MYMSVNTDHWAIGVYESRAGVGTSNFLLDLQTQWVDERVYRV